MVNLSPPDEETQTQFDRDGFVICDELIPSTMIAGLHAAFDDLFNGKFETGVQPDEINWQSSSGDPVLSRQICNGWKANRAVAEVVLDGSLARAAARFAGWSGARIMIDNVIWKPPGCRSLAFHQDNAYLAWYQPAELLTCWIALDETQAHGGTIEYCRGSHHWSLSPPTEEFHAPADYRAALKQAAEREGENLDIVPIEVPAGGGTFHHGRVWHGSGANDSQRPRRSLVLHAMPADVEYVPQNFDQGTGPIYSRYKRLGDNTLDENYFPVLWRDDGYRTPAIEQFLRGSS